MRRRGGKEEDEGSLEVTDTINTTTQMGWVLLVRYGWSSMDTERQVLRCFQLNTSMADRKRVREIF